MQRGKAASSLVKGSNSPHPSLLQREEFISSWDFLLHIRSETHPNSYTIITSFPIKAKKTLCSLTDCSKHRLVTPSANQNPCSTSVCVQFNMHHAWPLYIAGRDPSLIHLVLATKKPGDNHAPELRFPSLTMHGSLQSDFLSSILEN